MSPYDNEKDDDASVSPSSEKDVFFSHAVIKGVPWVIVGKLAFFMVTFLTSIVLVRGLEEQWGIFSQSRLMIEFLVIICCLGLNTAVARFVPELWNQNSRGGVIKLLLKAVMLQLLMVLIAAPVLYFGKSFLDERWFKIDSGWLLVLVVLVTTARLWRTLLEDTLTALFCMKTVSILSVIYGVMWLLFTMGMLHYSSTAADAFIAQLTALVLINLAGTGFLVRFFQKAEGTSSGIGLGKRRILATALPSQFSALANMMMRRFSEMFFIGFFFTPILVGRYDIGNGFPLLVISFVPIALQKLFTSGFAEAYAKDPESLGRLTSAYFKALIVLVMPISAFGTFFGTDIIILVYGENRALAGPIASYFFLIHMVSLFFGPLSMAVLAKEKILHTQPLTVFQIAVKLVLSWFLIQRYGIYGACFAVLFSYVLTIPVCAYVIGRLIGGIFFPMRFFLKIALVLFVWAAILSPLSMHLNIFTLGALFVLFSGVYLFLIRFLKLVSNEDVKDLRQLGFQKVNSILDLALGKVNTV
jgi:O-antigen/teichoic acid export membrane protein